MLRPKNLLLAIMLLPIIASSAFACQCFAIEPACAAYWEADAVFIGSVTEISPSFDDFESKIRTNHRRVRFSLEKAYRGLKDSEVVLENWINGCEYRFEIGKKYFVYAYRNTQNNTLSTQGCTRTRALSYATEDIAYIQAISKKNFKQNISGVIQEGGYSTPVKGIKVVASGKGKRFQSISDSQGWFKIVIPKAGKYKVRIFLPPDTIITGSESQIKKISRVDTFDKHTIVEYDLEIQNGKCEFLDIPASIKKDGS